MFRIQSLTLYKGTEKKEYRFTNNTYVYGHNNVGKTALTKTIDFVLGSTDLLSHAGLDSIEEVGAYVINNATELWIKRNLKGEYFYKRTASSGYTLVSAEKYKETICELITDNIDTKALKVYHKVFDEMPTYRSFTFLNFIDEIGQGDLGAVFTRGKEIKHLVRIRNIMDFFFNYENIEMIYEKKTELDRLEEEYRQLSDKMNQYLHSVAHIKKLFTTIGMSFSDEMSSNYERFKAFQQDFSRKNVKPTGDLVYLTKASYSLSEELKFFSYLKEQSQETDSRKERTARLLSIMQSIVAENDKYADDVASITQAIDEIQQDRLILSLADYDTSIEQIEAEKAEIDRKIELLKRQASEIDYEMTLKIIALLENDFAVINSVADLSRVSIIENEIIALKKEIKILRNGFSQKRINEFNNRLSEMYLNSVIENVTYLDEDRKEIDFCLVFDPFSQVLVAKHREGKGLVAFTPGSMARHTHLQLLVYLCMLEYLHLNFSNFIYLPIMIIDSADQAMDDKSFDEIYPSIVEIAKSIGVQTIFISKYKPASVNDEDLIDITEGFNPFHLSSKS